MPKTFTPDMVRLPRRKADTHKYHYGKLLILGGSVGYTGAVSLCAKAAVRAGAGLVKVGVTADIYPIIAAKLDEPMPFPLSRPLNGEAVRDELSACTSLVIGPGLGRRDDAQTFARDVIACSTVPTVVDADALWAVKDDLQLLRGKIITPHAGEFRYLGGSDPAEFARKHGCTVVLKGHETTVAFPDGEVYVCPVGNPGMATGGSGDVLAGVIGALLGQLTEREAVLYGVCIHGAAGDLCAERLGEYSMTPTDMIAALPEIMKNLTER